MAASSSSRAALRQPPRAPADGPALEPRYLFTEALDGLRRGRARGIGVDTWGVDYGLLDGDGNLLGLPFHYRDGRTEGMAERAFDRVSAAELYAVTGIQTLPINTVFQLLAEKVGRAVGGAGDRADPRSARVLALR